MSEQPLGGRLDALGVTADIPDGTLIASAVVVLRSILPDGTERLSVAHSDGLGRIEAAGMLHIAAAMRTESITRGRQPGA